jgi:hypothetical protein
VLPIELNPDFARVAHNSHRITARGWRSTLAFGKFALID